MVYDQEVDEPANQLLPEARFRQEGDETIIEEHIGRQTK